MHELLGEEERADALLWDSAALGRATSNGHLAIVDMLLTDPRVSLSPEAKDRQAFLLAAIERKRVDLLECFERTRTMITQSSDVDELFAAAVRSDHMPCVELVAGLVVDHRLGRLPTCRTFVEAFHSGQHKVVSLLVERCLVFPAEAEPLFDHIVRTEGKPRLNLRCVQAVVVHPRFSARHAERYLLAALLSDDADTARFLLQRFPHMSIEAVMTEEVVGEQLGARWIGIATFRHTAQLLLCHGGGSSADDDTARRVFQYRRIWPLIAAQPLVDDVVDAGRYLRDGAMTSLMGDWLQARTAARVPADSGTGSRVELRLAATRDRAICATLMATAVCEQPEFVEVLASTDLAQHLVAEHGDDQPSKAAVRLAAALGARADESSSLAAKVCC